jgi:DNA-directed RNA polymerase subunit RPC12/RpoP
MSTDSIDLLCKHCGQTFSAFLHEMAEKNAKVVCPSCGKRHDCKPATAAKAGTGARSIKKTV